MKRPSSETSPQTTQARKGGIRGNWKQMLRKRSPGSSGAADGHLRIPCVLTVLGELAVLVWVVAMMWYYTQVHGLLQLAGHLIWGKAF